MGRLQLGLGSAGKARITLAESAPLAGSRELLCSGQLGLSTVLSSSGFRLKPQLKTNTRADNESRNLAGGKQSTRRTSKFDVIGGAIFAIGAKRAEREAVAFALVFVRSVPGVHANHAGEIPGAEVIDCHAL